MYDHRHHHHLTSSSVLPMLPATTQHNNPIHPQQGPNRKTNPIPFLPISCAPLLPPFGFLPFPHEKFPSPLFSPATPYLNSSPSPPTSHPLPSRFKSNPIKPNQNSPFRPTTPPFPPFPLLFPIQPLDTTSMSGPAKQFLPSPLLT
jgi:hypothetical protein